MRSPLRALLLAALALPAAAAAAPWTGAQQKAFLEQCRQPGTPGADVKGYCECMMDRAQGIASYEQLTTPGAPGEVERKLDAAMATCLDADPAQYQALLVQREKACTAAGESAAWCACARKWTAGRWARLSALVTSLMDDEARKAERAKLLKACPK
ncbi:MAG: hypothetical protein QM767_28730 [Anaeromyxobacter sp.]